MVFMHGRCGRNRTSKCSKTSVKDFRFKNSECINIKMPSSDIQSFFLFYLFIYFFLFEKVVELIASLDP